MEQNNFELMWKPRKKTLIQQPSVPSKQYIGSIPSKNNHEYGHAVKTYFGNRSKGEFQRNSLAIFPPDLEQIKRNHPKEERKSISFEKGSQKSNKDLSNYNENQMNERMSNISPINREMSHLANPKLDRLSDNIFVTPAISINSERSGEGKKLYTNERTQRLAFSSFKIVHNPCIPESTRVKSQFKVMRGYINKSQTFMGNKFLQNSQKSRMTPILKDKFIESLQDDIPSKEGEIQDVIQSEKDYKTFKMKSQLQAPSRALNKGITQSRRGDKSSYKFLIRDDACLND